MRALGRFISANCANVEPSREVSSLYRVGTPSGLSHSLDTPNRELRTGFTTGTLYENLPLTAINIICVGSCYKALYRSHRQPTKVVLVVEGMTLGCQPPLNVPNAWGVLLDENVAIADRGSGYDAMVEGLRAAICQRLHVVVWYIHGP